MERTYTQDVQAGFFDMIHKDLEEIWAGLDRRTDEIQNGNWKEYYSNVVDKYRFSSRFAMMRVLFEIATNLSPYKPRYIIDEEALKRGFSVARIGNFPDVTIQHAQTLTDEELNRYQELLLLRVEENNPDFCEEAAGLIARFFELPDEGTKCNLTRNELIRLGHMVNFSLEHMQFLLLRVLGDNEAGFRYSAAMDLIDMYGFIIRAPMSEVDDLKSWYCKSAGKQKKVSVDEKPVHLTQDIADSLEQTFSKWSPEEREKNMKEWLKNQAPTLDLPAKSARKIYIHLATYACLSICERKRSLPDNICDIYDHVFSNNFAEDMELIAFDSQFRDYHTIAKLLLFDGNKPNPNRCKAVAATLVYSNATFARNFIIEGFDKFKDNSKMLDSLYHTLKVKDGKLTPYGEENMNSRERVANILVGKESPLKSDLLYLLWIIANHNYLTLDQTAKEKACFLDDFLDAAAMLLDEATLPAFYPPNVLEDAMLLSIVLGDSDNSPASIYESICRTFSVTLKPEGTTEKTPEERKEIVAYYYDQLPNFRTKGDCIKACIEHFKERIPFSEKSFPNYRAQYIAQYCLENRAEYQDDVACMQACAKEFNEKIKMVEKACKAWPNGLSGGRNK